MVLGGIIEDSESESETGIPFLKDIRQDLLVTTSSDHAAHDNMRRYEKTFPADPAEILTDLTYLTDLPVCLNVVRGNIPKSP